MSRFYKNVQRHWYVLCVLQLEKYQNISDQIKKMYIQNTLEIYWKSKLNISKKCNKLLYCLVWLWGQTSNLNHWISNVMYHVITCSHWYRLFWLLVLVFGLICLSKLTLCGRNTNCTLTKTLFIKEYKLFVKLNY